MQDKVITNIVHMACFIDFAFVCELSFKILVKKFKCCEHVTFVQMWWFNGKRNTKFLQAISNKKC